MHTRINLYRNIKIVIYTHFKQRISEQLVNVDLATACWASKMDEFHFNYFTTEWSLYKSAPHRATAQIFRNIVSHAVNKVDSVVDP